MKVAILCEFSGVVRDAFLRERHDAISCDFLPTERPGPHLQGDCLEYDWSGYDLVVCHPPCTYLASSGSRWWKGQEIDQWAALNFVRELLDLPVPRIALENPIGAITKAIRKWDQIIQPWQFGHPETKATCLWLKGLPKLEPTQVVEADFMRKADGSYYQDSAGKRYSRIHFVSGRMKDRWKIRSRTLPGIAAAMAKQWGKE